MSTDPTRVLESTYPREQLQTATPGRRLGGFLLDSVLFWLTLIVGWIVWSMIVAERGQTPGKQLLGLYVMREDGSRAGGWYTILREWVVYGLLFAGLLGAFTSGLSVIVGGVWCVWDRERQCLWDKVASTYVAYSPSGFRPLTANEMRMLGQEPPATGGIPTGDRESSSSVQPPGQPDAGSNVASIRERSNADRLRELQRLHGEDLIADEEYEERRAQIMDQL